MPSRAQLELRGANVGVDPDDYPNDSKFEQKVLFEEKQAVAATGVKASGTVTVSGQPATTGTVTIDTKTYTFRTALTGVRATGTITTTGTFTADEEIVIGNKTYTMVSSLTDPAVANEVLIGASAAASLDNLKSAINGTAGAGSTYGTGTVAHTQVRATTNADDSQIVQALAIGTAGNSIATTTDAANASWGAAALAGGVASVANEVLIGSAAADTLDNLKLAVNGSAVTEFAEEYSTGTTANSRAEATTNTDTTQLIEARTAGDKGNDIVFTEAATNLTISPTGGTLSGGTDTTDVDSASVYAAVARQESGDANV